MDKTRLVVAECFCSASEGERKESFQQILDRYILLQIKNGNLPTDDTPPGEHAHRR